MDNYLEIYNTFDERERSTSFKTKTLVKKTVSDIITRIKSNPNIAEILSFLNTFLELFFRRRNVIAKALLFLKIKVLSF